MTKQLRNIYSIPATVFCLFLLSCQPAKQVADESADSGKTSAVSNRGFDPLELSADRDIIPIKYPRSGSILGSDIETSGDSASADSGLTSAVIPMSMDTTNSQAYRIQVFTSKLYGEAKKELRIAEEIFDRPVFVDYEVPYFKVRVGSFSDRDEAEKYRQKVKAAGYRTAWVVIVNLAVKKAADLYDDGYLHIYEDSTFNHEDSDTLDQ